jgi:ParB-like chromosome segregation protein Spo0J
MPLPTVPVLDTRFDEKGGIVLYQVPLAELQPDPAQPRKYMDPAALEEMTASVGKMGIIEPVVCRQDLAAQ